MRRKLFAIMLALVLLLSQSACSNNTDKAVNSTAPNYIVKDIAESLGLKAVGGINTNSAGQLVIFDKSGGTNRYITVDADGGIANEIKCDFIGAGSVFAYDDKNNLYILVQDYVIEEDGNRIIENARQILVYSTSGEVLRSVELGKAILEKDENLLIDSMTIDLNGNIYLARYNESPELFSKDGRPLKASIPDGFRYLAIDESGNIIAGAPGAKGVKAFIVCMEQESDKEIWKKELELGISIYSICYNKGDKCIYALTGKGVDKYNSEGNFLCTVMDFMKYGLRNDEAYISKMCVDPSGNLYLLVFENGSVQVKKYQVKGTEDQASNSVSNPDSTMDHNPTAEKKKIRLAAHYSDRWLETAVTLFQAKHPDIEVNIEAYKGAFYGPGDTEEEFDKRREQFVTAINTEMMAGRGPDIVCFGNNLPYRKYIDKNMFANLSELMEKDTEFNKAGLNWNVINALKYRGGISVMPVGYQFELMYASKPILDSESLIIDDLKWTWNEFMQIAEKVNKDTDNDGVSDQYSTYLYSNEEILFILSDIKNYVDIEKKEAYFTSDDFIRMLELCKTYTDKELLIEETNIEKVKDMSLRGGIAFVPWSVSDYFSVDYIKSYFFTDDVCLLRMPTNNTGSTRSIEFIPRDMFAINSDTKYKNEAWEFLKLLLSKEQQASPSSQIGFPINNEALEAIADRSMNVLNMKQETIDEINEFIPDVRAYQYDDGQVRSIIKTEVADFFDGNRSAEETARIIQNKVTLYLNE